MLFQFSVEMFKGAYLALQKLDEVHVFVLVEMQ